MTLTEILTGISPPDQTAADAARARWNSIAKPLNGLGLLENAIVRIAGASGNPEVRLTRRACVVMCADNGVTAEGVTQTGSDVTAIVTENIANGRASVSLMAKTARCDVIPVDIGVAAEVAAPGLLSHKIAYSSGNIAREPAMTREQAVDAITYSVQMVEHLKQEGYAIIATGEMGIGNTTTAAAVASVLLGLPPEQLVGRGAGLSDAGLERKRAAVSRAIALHMPPPDDPLEVLCKVGGFDLAGMAGLFLGGALAGVPIVIDGFISAVAALAAMRLCPMAQGYWLASHLSKEPATHLVLDALGLTAPITAQLCLGEGTGAVALLPLLDMALAVYHGMPTFADIAINAYQPQEKITC